MSNIEAPRTTGNERLDWGILALTGRGMSGYEACNSAPGTSPKKWEIFIFIIIIHYSSHDNTGTAQFYSNICILGFQIDFIL